MATAVRTTVTDLPESRVRVEAEIAAEEIQQSLERQARKLGQSMKVPGFRTGKIPPAVVIQRIGRDPILDEAVRDKLTDWYLKAVEDSGIAPVGDPEVDLGDLPPAGKPLTFSFEVGVRPTAELGTYLGVEVARREPEADPDAVDAQIDEMRQRFSRLEVVDRPAENGDFVIIDFVGTVDGEPFSGGEGRDQLIDLGAGQLIPGFEDGLIGASAGDELTIDATFPEDYAASHVKGKDAQFQITVKEVKHRDLPDLDDEFASDAAGYDTLEELRESIASELLEHDKGLVESEFRAGALDAIVEGATVDVPDKLVEARAKELLDRMLHALGHQGITKEHYLKISGKAEEELIEESKPDAEQALRREAVLAAVIKAEAIEPTEQQLLDALEGAAEREQLSREKLLAKLRQAGRVEHLAAEVAAEMALDLVVTEAKPISPDEAGEKNAKAEPKKKPAAKKKAAAKKGKKGDDLWTPDADAPEGDKGKLWTPGS
ncbi:MAG: trigger factor [Solirubrobacteraceae bacterium]|jgi:trigger factor|nr:trigger factor [Solirubrobacteraceae bacterium]